MIRIVEVIFFICAAGFFDGVMDMIKDFHHSLKNWLYQWCLKYPKYLDWYEGGELYNPKYPWTSDAWHMAKHFMLLSFTCSVAIALHLDWYYQIFVWWFLYWTEGQLFNLVYQRLK